MNTSEPGQAPQGAIEAAARRMATEWFWESGTLSPTEGMVNDLAENYHVSARAVLAAAVAHPEFLPWILREAGYTHTTQQAAIVPLINDHQAVYIYDPHDRQLQNPPTHRRDAWYGPWGSLGGVS